MCKWFCRSCAFQTHMNHDAERDHFSFQTADATARVLSTALLRPWCRRHGSSHWAGEMLVFFFQEKTTKNSFHFYSILFHSIPYIPFRLDIRLDIRLCLKTTNIFWAPANSQRNGWFLLVSNIDAIKSGCALFGSLGFGIWGPARPRFHQLQKRSLHQDELHVRPEACETNRVNRQTKSWWSCRHLRNQATWGEIGRVARDFLFERNLRTAIGREMDAQQKHTSGNKASCDSSLSLTLWLKEFKVLWQTKQQERHKKVLSRNVFPSGVSTWTNNFHAFFQRLESPTFGFLK